MYTHHGISCEIPSDYKDSENKFMKFLRKILCKVKIHKYKLEIGYNFQGVHYYYQCKRCKNCKGLKSIID